MLKKEIENTVNNQEKKLNKFQKFYYKHYNNIHISLIFAGLILLSLGIINTYNNKTISEKYSLRLTSKYSVVTNEVKEIPELVIPEVETHVSLEVIDDGYNIYAPVSNGSGYRYGPSILINDDNSLDIMFSSPGNNSSEWDWITYKHSDDSITWGKEKIILQPTGSSMDHYSVCDPGLIYFNGYYYLGYTSTIVSTNEGINNNVFVARSKNIDGPYEKWNGNGWGGEPKPIIYYNESNDFWGAGEVSFVIKNNTLFCYYSWHCEHGNYTRVSTADLSENWPSTLSYQGVAFEHKQGQDSCDVVYLEEYDKFLAFSVAARFTEESSIIIFESDDGIKFKKSDAIHDKVSMYAHNMGISKHLDGHISIDDDLYISYAYSNSKNSKGRWATRFQPINLIIYEDTNFKSFDNGCSSTYRSNMYSTRKSSYLSGIGVKNKTINLNMGDTSSISIFGYDQYHSTMSLSKKATYEYDENIINMVGNKIIPINEGQTEVIVHYKDFYTTVNVKVHDENFNPLGSKEIITFEPVQDNIELHLEDERYHTVQIRAYVEFSNGTWGEAYNDYTIDHPKYKAMIDASKYHMQYKSQDENIAYVDDKGIVYPHSAGKTKIKVTINDDHEFIVDVIVDY